MPFMVLGIAVAIVRVGMVYGAEVGDGDEAASQGNYFAMPGIIERGCKVHRYILDLRQLK
jgi:hypothetical protein